jgi:hypothetical protein
VGPARRLAPQSSSGGRPLSSCGFGAHRVACGLGEQPPVVPAWVGSYRQGAPDLPHRRVEGELGDGLPEVAR